MIFLVASSAKEGYLSPFYSRVLRKPLLKEGGLLHQHQWRSLRRLIYRESKDNHIERCDDIAEVSCKPLHQKTSFDLPINSFIRFTENETVLVVINLDLNSADVALDLHGSHLGTARGVVHELTLGKTLAPLDDANIRNYPLKLSPGGLVVLKIGVRKSKFSEMNSIASQKPSGSLASYPAN